MNNKLPKTTQNIFKKTHVITDKVNNVLSYYSQISLKRDETTDLWNLTFYLFPDTFPSSLNLLERTIYGMPFFFFLIFSLIRFNLFPIYV